MDIGDKDRVGRLRKLIDREKATLLSLGKACEGDLSRQDGEILIERLRLQELFTARLQEETDRSFPGSIYAVPSRGVQISWTDGGGPTQVGNETLYGSYIEGCRASVREYRVLLEGYGLPFPIHDLIRRHSIRKEIDIMKWERGNS